MDVPYNGLIVAIDYGTTFTGIAFQPTVYDQDDVDLAKSTVVTKWSDRIHEAKVPSQISYSANLEGRLKWGREITAGSRPMIWTKLQLDQQDDRLADLKEILDTLEETENLDAKRVRREWRDPTHLTKEPIDIITDYLREVRVAAVREIKAAIGHTVVPRLVTDIVITVPAIWSDTAKNLTFRAVNKAGFTKRYFHGLRDVIFVTEPEAAALYSIKSIIDRRADNEVIGVGDCFVQADLGGGTVDVISYRVEAIQPSLRLRQVGLASGYKCGATFVDRKFLAWLVRKLGDDFQKIFPPPTTHGGSPENSIHELLEEFEQMRRNLDATGNLKMEHQVIRLKGRDFVDLTLPGKGVEGGRILVTSEEMRGFFQYSLSNIISLIASQISEIDRAGYSTQYVFLSGGFAESNYIHQEVQLFCRLKGVHVCRPDSPLIAVCKGAVAAVQEQVTDSRIRMRESSRSFGIVVSQPFSPYLHADRTGYDDPFEGGHKVREQITWLIKKGDLLLSNEEKHVHIEFCRRFGPNDPKVFINRFISSISDNPPSSLAELDPDQRNITSAQYDLEPISDQLTMDNEGDYLTARLRAGISLGKTSQWYISFNGRTLVTVPLDSIA